MISVRDVISIILACCGGIITIGGALSVIIGWMAKLKSPEQRQDEAIKGLECRVEKLEKNQAETSERTKKIEDLLNALVGGQFALINHAINGNNVEQLKEAQLEMQKFIKV